MGGPAPEKSRKLTAASDGEGKRKGARSAQRNALALFPNRRYAASTRGATATRAGAGARRFLPPSKAAKIAATTEAAKCALRRSTYEAATSRKCRLRLFRARRQRRQREGAAKPPPEGTARNTTLYLHLNLALRAEPSGEAAYTYLDVLATPLPRKITSAN